jgi:hypothetical protein
MDFGAKEQTAQEALNVIRQLRLTQRGAIGHPVPIMEYWLSEGQAPHAFGGGMRLHPIDRKTLRVEQFQGQWCVLDDRRLLFNFGPLEQDARQALAVIRDHAFEQIGYVGLPQPAMIYFVGGRGTAAAMPQPDSIAPLPIAKGDKDAAAKTDKTTAADKKNGPPLNPLLLQQAQMAARGMMQLAPPPAAGGTHLRFDPQTMALRQENGAWRLYAGSRVLADFGSQSSQAQTTLRVLKDYGCNEQCVVGLPTPSMSYFLSNGHAPTGMPRNLEGRGFQPDKVNVRQHLNNWYVCEGNTPLLFFGDRKQDAQDVSQAIHRYRFDFIAQMGAPGQPALSLFMRSN